MINEKCYKYSGANDHFDFDKAKHCAAKECAVNTLMELVEAQQERYYEKGRADAYKHVAKWAIGELGQTLRENNTGILLALNGELDDEPSDDE